MNAPVKVVIPTVHRADCPTIHSRLLPWCRVLTRNGFTFTFLVLEGGAIKDYPGVVFRGYKNYLELAMIIARLSKPDCDVILSCKPYSLTGVLSWLVARSRRIAYVLDVDDRIFPSEINKLWRLPVYLQEWCMEQFLRQLKPTTIVASRALADYWGPHAHYIPNTVDLEIFSLQKFGEEKAERNRLKLSGRVIIWPAVFFQEVDRDYILEIFYYISLKAKNISLLIVGDGEYLPAVKHKVETIKLTNVKFAGAVDHAHMPKLYAAVDAGILPLRDNHYDACKGPIKLYEYMAMELPVIATPVGEPEYVIRNADCGVVIPIKNAAKAADLIIDLFSSEERLRTVGLNGRSYLEKFQHLGSLAEKVKNVLLAESRRKN